MNRKALIVMGLVAASWLIVGYAFATISRAHILGELTAERQSSDRLRQEFDRVNEKLRIGTRICSVFDSFSEMVLNGEVELADEDQWCADLIQMTDKRKA